MRSQPMTRSFARAFDRCCSRGSFEARRESTIVDTVYSAATSVLGAAPNIIGEPYWMDAALLADAGIETVVIGPTGAGAHAAREWVDLASVESVGGDPRAHGGELLRPSAIADLSSLR